MRFFKFDLIGSMALHQTGKLAVEFKKQIDANTEITGIKQGTLVMIDQRFCFLKVLVPGGSANNDRNLPLRTKPICFKASSGRVNSMQTSMPAQSTDSRGTCELILAKNGMTSFCCDWFNGLTHFAVTKQCDIHGLKIGFINEKRVVV